MVTVTVHCALTLSLTAPRGADLSSLRALMSQALPPNAQRAQLRWAGTTCRAGRGLRAGHLSALPCRRARSVRGFRGQRLAPSEAPRLRGPL